MGKYEETKNYIEKELYTFLSYDEKVNEMYEIILWENCSSIYLQSKSGEKDGYIITTMPYLEGTNLQDKEMCFKMTIIAVDSSKNPKLNIPNYMDNTSNETIKNYLTRTNEKN